MLMVGNFGAEFAKRAAAGATHMAGQKVHRIAANTMYPEQVHEPGIDQEQLPEYLFCVDNSESPEDQQAPTGVMATVTNNVSPEDVGQFIAGAAGSTIFYFVLPTPLSMLGTLLYVFGNAIFGEISQSVGKYAGSKFKRDPKLVASQPEEGLYEFSVMTNEKIKSGDKETTVTRYEQHDFSREDSDTFCEAKVKLDAGDDGLALVDDYKGGQKPGATGEDAAIKAPQIVPVTKKLINQNDLQNSLVAKLAKQGKLNMVLFNSQGQIQFIYYRGKIDGLGLKAEQPKDNIVDLTAQLQTKLKLSAVAGDQKPAEMDHMQTVLNLFSFRTPVDSASVSEQIHVDELQPNNDSQDPLRLTK